jgi:hypothetical protein
MRTGRIVMIVLGAIAALIALGLIAAGGVSLWAHETQRDADGFFTSEPVRLQSSGAAIASDSLDAVHLPVTTPGFADVRLEAAPLNAKPTFIGIGPAGDVQAYLQGVARTVITDIDFPDPTVRSREEPGGDVSSPPGAQTFWVASVEGPGEQTLVWEVEGGRWAAVTMNADGSRGIAVEMTFGARIGWLLWAAIGMLIGGTVLLAIGAILIYLGARPTEPPPRIPPGEPPSAEATPGELVPGEPALLAGAPLRPPSTYPIQVEGTLDPQLSRWLWLVKWILAIPHWIILTFLWIGFAVLTIVSFFAILINGRYPRGVFDFNVGVLRWSWRVAFYTYSGLGTDRYPPFSLGEEPDYPATLDVPYPERLSRGLVLVKWWLLAIPHYIVVAIFEGGWGFTNTGWGWGAASWSDNEWTFSFPGLIGILVLCSAIALLFTGRYPRDIFDFVVGMNRWVYRVLGYVSLMRDEYPPFRLSR